MVTLLDCLKAFEMVEFSTFFNKLFTAMVHCILLEQDKSQCYISHALFSLYMDYPLQQLRDFRFGSYLWSVLYGAPCMLMTCCWWHHVKVHYTYVDTVWKVCWSAQPGFLIQLNQWQSAYIWLVRSEVVGYTSLNLSSIKVLTCLLWQEPITLVWAHTGVYYQYGRGCQG